MAGIISQLLQNKTTDLELPETGVKVKVLSYYPKLIDTVSQDFFLSSTSLDMKKAMNSEDDEELNEKDILSVGHVNGEVVAKIFREKIKIMVQSVNGSDYDGDKDALVKDIYMLPEKDFKIIEDYITEVELKAKPKSPKGKK